MEIDENSVLVPKLGKDKEFYEILKNIHRIASGKLGWQGHAEFMLDVFGKQGLQQYLGIKLKSRKKEKLLAEIEELLKQSFLQSLYDHGEWVTKEVALTRKALFDPEVNK